MTQDEKKPTAEEILEIGKDLYKQIIAAQENLNNIVGKGEALNGKVRIRLKKAEAIEVAIDDQALDAVDANTLSNLVQHALNEAIKDMNVKVAFELSKHEGLIASPEIRKIFEIL